MCTATQLVFDVDDSPFVDCADPPLALPDICGPPRAQIPPGDYLSWEEFKQEWNTPHPVRDHSLPRPEPRKDWTDCVGIDADGRACDKDGDWLWTDRRPTGPHAEMVKTLWRLGLENKAIRLRNCLTLGSRIKARCDHSYFQRYRCGLRFCPNCGPANYRELFEKFVLLKALVIPRRGWVLALLDFTLVNTGQLPETKVIRRANRAVRETMHRVLRGIKGWGYLFADDFGFNHTNLHMHGLYYGPLIPQRSLSDAWLKETGDSYIVSIKLARRGFEAALGHMLKYVSKPPGDNLQHLARLEAAFHGVDRVHRLGVFYGAKLEVPDKPNDCPLCGEGYPLIRVSAYCPIDMLEAEGLRDIEVVRRELARQRIFSGAGPP